jgi:hypothetical protein
MKHHVKRILLAVSILVLLVGACDTQPQDTVDPAGAPGAEPPPGAPVEARPTPTPAGSVGDAEQVTTEEASQADQTAPSAEEPVSGAEPEHAPSEEERNAILDRVNRGGPVVPGGDEEVGEGPEPGTESGMGGE